MTGAGGRGFWRRNRWGMVALVPALIAALVMSSEGSYERWAREPRSPVTAGADGAVSFAGAQLRLLTLAPFQPVTDAGEPLVPPGVRAWRATLHIGELADPEALIGCEVQLTDDRGRHFGDFPSELVRASISPASCVPEDEGSPEVEVAAHFLLPESARPAGVRVIQATRLPAYAWLEPAPG